MCVENWQLALVSDILGSNLIHIQTIDHLNGLLFVYACTCTSIVFVVSIPDGHSQ